MSALNIANLMKYVTCTSSVPCAVYGNKIVLNISSLQQGATVDITLNTQFGCSKTLSVTLPCSGNYMVIYIHGHSTITYL